MKICINAGHTLDGAGSGAVGIKNESIETRKVAKEVIRLLKQEGHEIIDSTVDEASSQAEYLRRSVVPANENNCDLFLSIHFNAFHSSASGTEVLIYSRSSDSSDKAAQICERISNLGFENRGVKEYPELYVLRNTKMPAILVECCFIDSEKDMNIYNPEDMARAIAEGLLNKEIAQPQPEEEFYRICVGSFRIKENAENMLEEVRKNGYEDAFIIKC